jgi:polyhydroxyalkanoate synthase
LGGEKRFVLSGSGHIAGMINPPAANKYGYWTGDKLSKSADDWLQAAKQHEGSWWTDWMHWLKPHLGPHVPAREIGKTRGHKSLQPIEPAPGSYARQRADPR